MNRHITVADDKTVCKKNRSICSDERKCRHACYKDRSNDLKNQPEEFDNMDVIKSIKNKKELPADERLADRSIISGKKNKRAIDGAVRATRAQFQCHFEEELREGENRDWWDNNDYDTPDVEKNDHHWMERLSHFSQPANARSY